MALADAAHLPRGSWPHYRVVRGDSGDAVELDVAAFVAARGPAVTFVRDLLSATVARPAQLGCFGLHEWAMVHGIPADDVRHSGWPLRLGSAGTDAVDERHGIRCSTGRVWVGLSERRAEMWVIVGTLVLLALLALALKVMQRRASKDLDGAEELSAIAHRRLGRNDPYGGGGAGDGGGGGW